MKKIKEKYTIIDRIIFIAIFILLILIIKPIISDNIEQPKRDKAQSDAKKYIEILNSDLKKIKEKDEELFNDILKYNSFSKYCTISDIDKQLLECGKIKFNISSKEILADKDSIIYFSKDGIVGGYKIIIGNYKVVYPNSKGFTTVKRYHKQKESELKEG